MTLTTRDQLVLRLEGSHLCFVSGDTRDLFATLARMDERHADRVLRERLGRRQHHRLH